MLMYASDANENTSVLYNNLSKKKHQRNFWKRLNKSFQEKLPIKAAD